VRSNNINNLDGRGFDHKTSCIITGLWFELRTITKSVIDVVTQLIQ
jgi:hypothetical protein